MKAAYSTLLALGLCAGCGGSVEADRARDAGSDTSCVPGAPECPAPDASGTDAGVPDVTDDVTDVDAAPPDASSDADAMGDADAAPCAPIPGVVGPCDPMAQCGCPAGQACDNPAAGLDDAGHIVPVTRCRDAGTIGAFAGSCNGDRDCAPGLACWYGGCYPFCLKDSDCEGAPPYQTCFPREGLRPYGVCGRQCDPADPTRSGGGFYPCGPDAECVPCGPDAPCVKQQVVINVLEPGQTFCGPWLSEPAVAPGAPCDDLHSNNFCTPGYHCAPPDDDSGTAGCDAAFCAGVCRRWCHVGENGCDGGTCVPTGQYAGSIELGLCP